MGVPCATEDGRYEVELGAAFMVSQTSDSLKVSNYCEGHHHQTPVSRDVSHRHLHRLKPLLDVRFRLIRPSIDSTP